MSADFLLELACEEIPARMQQGARAELEKLFRRELEGAGVVPGACTIWSTPRRLALIARDLPEATEAVCEEIKGPPKDAPDQAVEGFCRKNGVTREEMELREVKGRLTYFAVRNIPGRAMAQVLAEIIPAIIRDFAWPKSMRWGAASHSSESPRWVRPLSGIVALLGDQVVECEAAGITSGRTARGHRFHHKEPIAITSPASYAGQLRSAYVIVDHAEREAQVREGAEAAARAAGFRLVPDEKLVAENAGLTEWPVPLLGRFDAGYLEVPHEVIQLTARVNQKYFVCEEASSALGSKQVLGSKLVNAFVCTANIEAADPQAVVDGNRRVLEARLSDARFFWEVDQTKTLEAHSLGLARITFHKDLGTLADKVERVARLARWLCEEGIVEGDPELAAQAAQLCKADLVTEMVGEFPELQGFMGGYYARAQGLDDAVCDAIRDHYKPVGQGDAVPTAPVTVAVSLADKLDTIVSFFYIGEQPTGSKDPFALRRAALAILALLTTNNLRLNLKRVIPQGDEDTLNIFEGRFFDKEESIFKDLLAFLSERLKVQQRAAGVRHDVIDAVFALGDEDDLVRLLGRVKALQSFLETDDGANLLAGYKRAANILKKEEWEDNALSYTPENSEKALSDALDKAEPQVASIIASEDFTAAMSALAHLREPIDRFFADVTVNADEPHIRAGRLALLARFRDAVHKVADFSQIVAQAES